MEDLSISVPARLKLFVDAQVSTGRYASASAYVCELIRLDARWRGEAELEALLLEGLGGQEAQLSAADWQHLRAEALSKVRTRDGGR